MNTKNTKSAIIILLMLANIFFIYNRIMLSVRTQNIPSSMIENAVNILENNGFYVDKSVIPAKKPANYIYEGVYSGDFKEIVTGFSGVPEQEIQDLPPLPLDKTKYIEGGYIFIFDKSDYFKISIMTEFHEKAKEDYRVSETETEEEIALLLENARHNIMSAQKNDIKKAEKIIKDFLKKYYNRQKSHTQEAKAIKEIKEIKSDLDIDILSLKKESGSGTEKIIINQKADGLPIDSHIAYVEIKNGEVEYFYGRWYFGNFVERYKWPLLDSVNILFKYAEKDGNVIGESIAYGDYDESEKPESTETQETPESINKIEKMEAEYNVLSLESDKFYLRPSWVLIFADGKKLSYDMIKGNKN